VCLAGDFNALNIDWSNLHVTLGSPYINCQQHLLDVIEDYCMTQVVTEFTRGDHILDLFLRNCPSLISDSTTLPGLSDHNMVLTKLSVKPPISKQTKRSILLYNKANWNAIHTGLQPLLDEFSNYNSGTNQINVDDMWEKFHSTLADLILLHIPHKVCKSHFSVLWITASLRKQIKKGFLV